MPLDGVFVGEEFQQINLSDQRIEESVFERCTFTQCAWSSVQIVDCRFEECTFDSCDLIACTLDRTLLNHVVFRGGRTMGMDWTGVRTLLFSARFESTVLDHSSFAGVPLMGFQFLNCRLREVDFTESDLSNTTFTGSDLTGAIIRHATLGTANFRESRGCFFDVSTCKLNNTQVNLPTALALLETLGVQCTDLAQILGRDQ